MDFSGLIQIILYLTLLTALTPMLGEYMARVFSGEKILATRLLGPVERGLHRICGVDPSREQHWTGYAAALLAFNLAGVLLLYAILRLQAWLPLNPQDRPPCRPTSLQHGGQLHHQHELAVVRRRDDDELPDPDGRADGAELRVRRDRHGGAGRADPRLRARARRRPSATSGSI